jgi:1-acyl-sn-glycerol-3-phosphate acyltransferase
MTAAADPAALTRFERFAIALGRLCNETSLGKRVQEGFLRSVTYCWIRAALAPRMFVSGLDELMALDPDRGIMLVSNHRSFFDQYAVMLGLWMGPVAWARRLYFPVRSNFFYEQPVGVLVNLLVGGGSMYPPVFRQRERSALNNAAVRKVSALLREPDVLVGMHPEGTRNKGDDPFTMLPAQPGVGAIALNAAPVVVPIFIYGLGNDFLREVRAGRAKGARRERPCICVFGRPIDYSDLQTQTPRPALYKQFADRCRDEILALGATARNLAEQCRTGAIGDDHPGWLANRSAGTLYARPGKRHRPS